MRHFYITLLLVMLMSMTSIGASAQQTTLEIDNQSPGWLSSKIGYGDQQTVENLKVTGYLNDTDLLFIASLCQNMSLHGRLDLGDANIVNESNPNYLNLTAFGNYKMNLSYFVYPKTITGGADGNSFSAKALRNMNTDTLCIKNPQFQAHMGATVKHLLFDTEIVICKTNSNYEFSSETIEFSNNLKEIKGKFNSSNNLRTFVFRVNDMSNLREFPSLERYEAIIGTSWISKDIPFSSPDSIFLPKIKVMDFRGGASNGSTSGDDRSYALLKKDGSLHLFLGADVDTLSYMSRADKINIHFPNPTPPVIYNQDRGTAGSDWLGNLLSYNDEYIFYVPKGSTAAYKRLFKSSSSTPKYKIIEEAQPVTGVSINPEEVVIDINETAQLMAIINPYNADDLSVTWSSEDESIATVDANGKVTGKKSGETYIQVKTTDGGFTARCLVKVKYHATGIELNETSIHLTKAGEAKQLVATVLPAETFDKSVTWTSSNQTVCTVSDDGRVVAVANGQATVIARSNDGGFSASCIVTVDTDIHVESVSIQPTEITLEGIGKQYQLSATVLPENATNKSLHWTSSNQMVCSVSDGGMISAVGTGTATITATSVDGSKKAECNVTVVQPVASLTLNKHITSIRIGESEELTATISPDNATDKGIVWTSSNTDIAVVNDKGVIVAMKAGKANITATSTQNQDAKDVCEVTVLQPVTGISISDSYVTMDNIGQIKELTATVKPDNASDKRVNWTSSDTSVCTVSDGGTVVATGIGTSVVTVTTVDGGFVAVCVVSVTITNGIETITIDWLDGDEQIYDTSGKQLNGLQKGLNIIRMKDGTIKKVSVR